MEKVTNYHFQLIPLKDYWGKCDYHAIASATHDSVKVEIIAEPRNLFEKLKFLAFLSFSRQKFLHFESSSILNLCKYLVENSKLKKKTKSDLIKSLQPEELPFVIRKPESLLLTVFQQLFKNKIILQSIEVTECDTKTELEEGYRLVINYLQLMTDKDRIDIPLTLKDALNLVAIYRETNTLPEIGNQLEEFCMAALVSKESAQRQATSTTKVTLDKNQIWSTLNAIDQYIIMKRKCPGCLKPLRSKFEYALTILQK